MAQTVLLVGASQRSFAKSLIDRAPVGAVLTIREANRSTDQNAAMWAMLSDISRAKPDGRHHTPEVWKELMMHACGHAVQFEMGLNGQPFPVGFRSSKLNKSQMADLLTFIRQWGDEKGVPWSDESNDNQSGTAVPVEAGSGVSRPRPAAGLGR
jgi:hypothetical protein